MNTPGYTLIHLTDTHLHQPDEPLFGVLDTWARTAEALRAAARYRPDAVVVTGDIADSGGDIYSAASELFARAGRELGCPVIVLPGNHDVPGTRAWAAEAFTGSRTNSGPGPGNDVHFVGGLRLITLDSDNPGQPAGRLTGEQLHWLDTVLAEPAPDGTVLALHHPPVDSLLPQLAGRGLARPAELAGVLAGTDVRAVLCGHYHHAMSGRLGAVPVWAGPAVSYGQDLFAPPETVQGLDSSWLSVIRLDESGFSAVPVPLQQTGAVVFSKAAVRLKAPAHPTVPHRTPIPHRHPAPSPPPALPVPPIPSRSPHGHRATPPGFSCRFPKENPLLHRSKYPALAVVSLASLALLTACSGSADGAENSPAASASSTSAGATGTLTVYTSEPQAKIDELVAAYNEVNPEVSVEVFRAGTGELKTRIATEKETGGIQADVILAADVPTFEAYAAEGDLQVLDIDNAGELNQDVVDAEGYYVGTRIIPTVIAYNTTLVDSAPESWGELTKDEYKGMIAMPNPDVSGAAAFNTTVWLETPALGENWLKNLISNEPTVLESNGPVGQAVAAGTSGIGIVVDYVARELAANGSPISLSYPTDGVPYVSQPAGVFNDSKNPDAANEFVEFLVSKEGQELAVAQSYLPVREDTGVPEGAPSLADLELLNPDLAVIAEKQASAVAKFNDLLK